MTLDDDFLATCFKHLGEKNPLRQLSTYDKRLIVAFLTMFLSTKRKAKDKEQFADLYKAWEEAAIIAAEAGKLAKRMQERVFEGQVADAFGPLLGPRDLPARLQNFSVHLSQLLDDLVGKPGHKAKVARTRFLIMGSEFVRQRTGSHNDEHLAELIQAVAASEGELQEFSGDMVRKRRENLDRKNNLLYLHLMMIISGIPEVPDTASVLRWKRPKARQGKKPAIR